MHLMTDRRVRVTGKKRPQLDIEKLALALVALIEDLDPRSVAEKADPDGRGKRSV